MRRSCPRIAGGATLLFLFWLILLAGATTTVAVLPADPAGHWEGTIDLPDTPLGVRVELVQDAATGQWTGSIDIPAQSAMGLSLTGIAVTDTAVSFAIANIPGAPTFHGHVTSARIEGTFSQNGMFFPFHLSRGEQPPSPRPQRPRPPFPYTVREVSYPSGSDTLAGTLTLPPGDGPFPAALLISGSGAQDRDETVFEHKPFLVLADHLTRAGIAVLRVDDRGVGGSTGSLREATSANLADDVRAGVDFLVARPEIDHGAIGLIGHSEGGIIAPMVAASDDRVAYIVLLAGPGVPGDQILLRQVELISRVDGMEESGLQTVLDAYRQLLAALGRGAPADSLRGPMRQMLAAQMPPGTSPETLDQAVTVQLKQLTSPWFRYFIGYDPRPTLGRVRVPVLALAGEKDLQVPPEQNLTAIAAALAEGGNRDVTTRVLPGLNHLFQAATTGSPREYHEIQETMNPAVLSAITDWILAHVGRGEGGGRR